MSYTCTILTQIKSLLKDINPSLCDLSNRLDTHAERIEELSTEIHSKQKPVSNLKRTNGVEELLSKMEMLNSVREQTIPVARQFIELLHVEVGKLTQKIELNKATLSQKGYNKAGWNLVKGQIKESVAELTKAKDTLTDIARNYEEGIEEFRRDIANDEKYIAMLKSLSTVKNGIHAGNYASGLPENLKATFPPIPGTGGKRTRRHRVNKKKRTRRSY